MAEIRVTLASQEIDINDVLEVQTSERSTSFPYATETQPHTAQVVLSDPDGLFGPDNVNNFFRQNMQNPNGARCPIEIHADSTVLFAGEVDDLRQNVPRATVTLRCIDNSRQIRIEALENFGLQKAWKLIEDTELSADNGVYPLTLGVAPLSEGSVTVSKALNDALDIVPEIRNAGILDADNVQITDRAVISEGDAIDVAAGSAYPQIQAKTPYRYQQAVTLVNAILQYYSLTNSHVEIPDRQIERHAEVLGRPGYETVAGNIGSSNHLSWYGYVTDILADGDTLYFAYSVNRGSVYFSSIEVYDREMDDWSTLYRHGTAGTEIWGLAKIGDNLILLLTDSDNLSAMNDTPAEGSYDSDTNSSVYLASLDVTAGTPTLTTLVATTDAYCPQLAHFYQIGTQTALVAGSAPVFEAVALPDTRRRLLATGSNLYYGWAKDGRVGVARVAIGGMATSLMDFASDSRNHAGFGYCFNGSQLILSTTFFDGVQSVLKVVRNQ